MTEFYSFLFMLSGFLSFGVCLTILAVLSPHGFNG